MPLPASPIIVRILDPPVRGLGLADTILNAVGLTGAMAAGAVLLGLVLAAGVIRYRQLRSRRMTDEEAAQTQSLGLNS